MNSSLASKRGYGSVSVAVFILTLSEDKKLAQAIKGFLGHQEVLAQAVERAMGWAVPD